MLTANLIMVAVLLFLTAFFVATEFAIVKIRPSRVDQLVQEGKKHAQAIKKVTDNLDGYLSACQLGITITALGLGWLGEPTVEDLLYPVFASMAIPEQLGHILSFGIAFSAITYLHVVLGELAPKTLAIQKAEAIASLCARPIILFYNIMYPFIWLLNGSANRFIGLFGLRPAKEHEEAHSEEELKIILSDSYKSGTINQTEYGYVERIFAFDELLAREIMVPRTDMICLDIKKPLHENLETMKTEQFTRFPVIDGDKDNIIGMLNAKKFFLNQTDPHHSGDISKMLQPVFSVSEVTPISDLLKMMQKNRVHMVLLMDEYGGTSGLITIEDILEEIVGEIQDEFDSEEIPEIQYVDDDHLIVDGKVSLTSLSELLQTEFDQEEFTTIGGWLYSINPSIRKGGRIAHKNLTFVIKEKDRMRIRKVEIWKHPLPVLDAVQESASAKEPFFPNSEESRPTND